MTQITSIKTYHELQEEGVIGKDQKEVYKALKELVKATDNEITKELCYLDPNKVRPRRKELVDIGVVKEIEKRNCKVTGRLAIVWGCSENFPEIPLNKETCLTERELNNILKKIERANSFQKNIIKKQCEV